MAQPLRKLLGIVALALGLSVSVGAPNASAGPLSSAAPHSAIFASASHISAGNKKDWWWK